MDPFRRFNSREKGNASTEQEKLAARKHRREKRDAGAAAGMPVFLQRSPASSAGPARDVQLDKLDHGHSLDGATRARMERQFGQDLRDVRIHTDSSAAQSAASLNAQAYTAGRDIVFGAGAYAPETSSGARLLAHELTHVVQQASGARASGTGGDALAIGAPSDRFEHAAERGSEQVLDDSSAKVEGGAASSFAEAAGGPAAVLPAIQRRELGGVLDVTLAPSPFLARSMGSTTLDAFGLDSAALTAAHQARVAAQAQTILTLLRSYPGGSLSMVGHTDATGAEAHNVDLGERRAAAVKAAFVAAGVPAEIISTSSAGETAPAVPSEQAEPRNRRVEVRFEPEVRVHLVPQLELAAPSLETPPPAGDVPPPAAPGVTGGLGPSPSLRLPPSYFEPHEETPKETGRRIFAPIPPGPAPGGTSLSQAVLDRVDSALNSAMRRLGIHDKFVQGKIRDLVHAGVGKAASGALESALDQTQLSPEQKEAIQAAVEAAVKTPNR